MNMGRRMEFDNNHFHNYSLVNVPMGHSRNDLNGGYLGWWSYKRQDSPFTKCTNHQWIGNCMPTRNGQPMAPTNLNSTCENESNIMQMEHQFKYTSHMGSEKTHHGESSSAQKSARRNSGDQVMMRTNESPRRNNHCAFKAKMAGARKTSPQSFPANVKNLLSTGIFEGVPVKYVSWSREKTLKGIIKGTNYLCGCDRCEMKTRVSAFEFERHAGCDTKHPNSHIFFPNGKSIYSVVQELKGIPRESLFHAIKTATGTPINIKNFLAWKGI
ncbi:hypothetical protein DM860_013541 [Cuscuta australis]|uniref:Tify domain-containing protein n=2 Tax=Cuscuta sect. Cleistogrammica TaxID=1824901 RepID=A0A328E9V9_9ASTE|nr:hypothetical protein DM860_013541 [Cuscuta australis]